jgi:predicted cupin superfamily sugar epimerase
MIRLKISKKKYYSDSITGLWIETDKTVLYFLLRKTIRLKFHRYICKCCWYLDLPFLSIDKDNKLRQF